MGIRSKFTLLKVGYDMRTYYEELVNEPIPSAMRTLIYQMAGSAPDVIELGPGDYSVVDDPKIAF